MKTPPPSLLVHALLAAAVAALLSSCGGGGGGGTGTNPMPSGYWATCGDGSYKYSSVSQAAADALCPAPKTAICEDQSTRTSYVSQEVVQMMCPTSVIAASTYDADKKSAYDRLNADRVKCGFGSVKQSALLDQAAQNHSNYLMRYQVDQHEEDPKLDGFTGINSEERMKYVGYSRVWGNEGLPGYLQWGKAFEQTTPLSWVFTGEPDAAKGIRRLYTLPYHAATMLSGYRDIGIGSATKDVSGADGSAFKKWLTFDYATAKGQVNTEQTSSAVLTFPCDGMEDIPTLQMMEAPDPFLGTDRVKNPYGMPVYIRSAVGTTLTLNSGTITLRDGAAVPTVWLNRANDPNRRPEIIDGKVVLDEPILKSHQVFLSPTVGLKDNSVYDVKLGGTNTGMITPSNPTGAFTKEFSFKTSTYTGE